MSRSKTKTNLSRLSRDFCVNQGEAVLVLTAKDLELAMDADALRETMRTALADLSEGTATNYPRYVQPLPGGALGLMPASSDQKNLLGFKVAAVFSSNPNKGLDAHQGFVTLLDPQTGVVQALLEASTLTALRTAAVSAAATAALARENSQVLSVMGTGRQAYEHVKALVRVRPLRQIYIYGRSPDHRDHLIRRLSVEIEIPVLAAPTLTELVEAADILVTATPTMSPLLRSQEFKAGTHVNAIGACRPGMQEILFTPQENLKVFVDSVTACALEADELRQIPIAGEIGACFRGQIQGRENPEQISVFKSVGLGLEDLYAAAFFVSRARNLGLGTTL